MEKKVSQQLTMKEKVSYGLGDCGANVAVAMCSTFLTAYYTDTVGIAAAAIGTMMLLTRIFDGITDIFMGVIVDRTSTRWGKARPWLLWTAPFMALALVLLFHVPGELSSRGKLVYIYLTYIFQSCFVYTANNLPYNALLSRMTLNVNDRASAASIRFVMTQITTLIINAVTAGLLATVGWFALSFVYGIITMVLLLICFWGVKEHLDEDAETGLVKVERVPLHLALPALLKNRYFYIQTLLFLFLYIAIVSTGSTTFYFCNIVLGNIGMITLISMAATIPAMIVNLIMPKLVKLYGKWKLMISGAVLMIIGYLIIGAAASNVTVVLIGVAVKGFGMGPIMSGLFAMTADVVDYGEWKTGIRSEGLVNSCTSFGMKVGIGVGSAVCTWIMAIGGYVGTAAVQSPSAVNMIRFGFGYNGAIISGICLILCVMMNIDRYIVEIQRDLEEKRENNRKAGE
ncbi:GPH family glycoside/pentoside/hexuronide:cation symporter [Lacrimispora xylanisolvens]|uniref:GPH family glycoside/pentoside/hexuronide:cation symporter n=1 Tax=Lacrimispora xylanisolvens TaxID=384636 RepID=A0A2S6HM49_9FIRM|nr:glycoside-pentoside-hexuronide (GPH):cation symporter [Hungatella xylanolytica]MBE5987589.1 MFS transporter [Paenibacillaceae bacterium]PPK78575.1 GPH family glycoside/pentoside/hexuronide:cation symporter [Hungatella xylanolytica]